MMPGDDSFRQPRSRCASFVASVHRTSLIWPEWIANMDQDTRLSRLRNTLLRKKRLPHLVPCVRNVAAICHDAAYVTFGLVYQTNHIFPGTDLNMRQNMIWESLV